MPTNPIAPKGHAAVERLTLGIEAPRGGSPSGIGVPFGSAQGPYACFEAEASYYIACSCSCFDSE